MVKGAVTSSQISAIDGGEAGSGTDGSEAGEAEGVGDGAVLAFGVQDCAPAGLAGGGAEEADGSVEDT